MASIAIECTLFGIFLVLSTTSLTLLVRRRALLSGTPVNLNSTRSADSGIVIVRCLTFIWEMTKSPLIVANVLLMLTVTAHWVLGIDRLFIAIVSMQGGQAANDFFDDLQTTTEVTRTAVLFVDMLVGDAVITYRTWMVWGRNNWVLVFPMLSISTLIVFGIGLLHEFGASNHSVFQSEIVLWILGFCAATLATNFYGTIMIAYRIMSTNRLMRKTRVLNNGRDLTSALAILVESAALYSAWAVMFVAFYVSKSTLQTIGSGCGPTVVGISFMLITVRVGLGWGQDFKPIVAESANMRSNAVRSAGLRIEENSAFPMRTFALNVTKTVEQETDYALTQNEFKRPDSEADTTTW